MDNIIEFRAGRPHARRVKTESGDGAKVLFFTGVRYENTVSDADPRVLCGTSFGEQRMVTAEDLEIALDLAAY